MTKYYHFCTVLSIILCPWSCNGTSFHSIVEKPEWVPKNHSWQKNGTCTYLPSSCRHRSLDLRLCCCNLMVMWFHRSLMGSKFVHVIFFCTTHESYLHNTFIVPPDIIWLEHMKLVKKWRFLSNIAQSFLPLVQPNKLFQSNISTPAPFTFWKSW